MPGNEPETVEEVLNTFNLDLKNATVDLSQTVTTEFAEKTKA